MTTRILLIEDDEMSRDMLARRLRRRGFDVETARTGRTGVDSAQSDPPDLVIMDLRLPGLDGWSATRQLKQDRRTRDVPVVALTAHALTTDRDQALAAGCDDYETKPVDFDRLLQKLRRLVPA